MPAAPCMLARQGGRDSAALALSRSTPWSTRSHCKLSPGRPQPAAARVDTQRRCIPGSALRAFPNCASCWPGDATLQRSRLSTERAPVCNTQSPMRGPRQATRSALSEQTYRNTQVTAKPSHSPHELGALPRHRAAPLAAGRGFKPTRAETLPLPHRDGANKQRNAAQRTAHVLLDEGPPYGRK